MPKIPKWLGDTMETLFSAMIHPVSVEDVVMLDTTLSKVRFRGDFHKARFNPGNVVEFRINETDYRHYTPSVFDSEQGLCEILFYLHAQGPGSAWAEQLQKGDKVNLMGPGGNLKYREEYKYHIIFGDETSLGLVECLKTAINANSQEYLCVLELDDAHRHWPALAGLSADVVSKSAENPAREAIHYLDGLSAHWKEAVFYLSGNARSIQALRKALIAQDIKSSQIRTEPYWSPGKKGL